MKKNEPAGPFREPTRQSPVAILLILLRLVRSLLRMAWPVLLVLVLNPKKQSFDALSWWIIGIASLSALGSIIAYFRFFFYLRNDELILEKGVLRRSKLNVPLDRIQTIELRQGLLHQWFEVVSVEIDTAGSKNQEMTISALSKPQAEALRDLLLEKRTGRNDGQEAPFPAEAEPHRREEVLLQLQPLDLLKIGVSQNHLRTAGIILLIALGIMDDLEEALDFSTFDLIRDWIGIEKGTVLLTILSAGIALLILSFFSSLIVTLFRFFNLRFLRTEAGFKIVAGLFNRREQAANLQKVQYIRWTINPIGRLFGLFSLRLLQASSQSVNRKESLNIPGCRFEQVARIRETYFPDGSELPSQEQPISPWFVRRRFLWLGIVPVAVLLGINALRGDLNWESAWPLLWLLPAWWLSRQAYRNWRLHLNERGVLIESGVFGRTFISLLWHKVQSVQLRQSLFQRRRNVADLILFTAAGSVRIPYLPLSAARKMRDYLVYYVESSRLAWM